MTEPKVSGRIDALIDDLVGEIHCHQCECMPDTRPDPAAANTALLSAIAEIEQRAGEIDFFASIVRDHYADIVMPTVEDRSAAKPSDWINCAILALGNQHKRAEKWKEAAVSAEHIFLGYEALEEADLDTEGAVDTAERLVTQAIERNNAAKKALGDEWDEAVKREG